MENVITEQLKKLKLADLLSTHEYDYCIKHGYSNLEQLLTMPRKDFERYGLYSLFTKIHSYNLKFDYEEDYVVNLAIRIKYNEVIPIGDFKFLLPHAITRNDGNGIFTNSSDLKQKIKLLVNMDVMSTYELGLIDQIFGVNTSKIKKDLSKLRYKDLWLNMPLKHLDLPTRAVNALDYNAKIKDLGSLILLSSTDLINFRNIGKGTCEIIINKVHSLGYNFADEMEFNFVKEMEIGDYFTKSTNNDEKSVINEDTSDAPAIVSESELVELKQDNTRIRERIDKKDSLLKEYQRLIVEKKELLQQEAEINSKIEATIDEIKKLYGDSYGRVKK